MLLAARAVERVCRSVKMSRPPAAVKARAPLALERAVTPSEISMLVGTSLPRKAPRGSKGSMSVRVPPKRKPLAPRELASPMI